VRTSCLGKGKSLRDKRLDLSLLKEVKEGDQILSKQCRTQPFEPLDAVGDQPFPAREEASRQLCTTRKWRFQEGDSDDLKPIVPHLATK
jgi:hypothetical protein